MPTDDGPDWPAEMRRELPTFGVPQSDGTTVVLDFTAMGPFGDFAFTARITGADGSGREGIYGAYHTDEAAIFVEIIQHWARVAPLDDILAGLGRAAAVLRSVRSHLAAAVDCALSLPPVSGKKVVENLQRDLDSNSWPRDSDVVAYLREQYFSRTRDSVQLNLVKLIVKCAVRPPAATDLAIASPNQLAHRCRMAVSAVNDISPGVLERGVEAVLASWVRSGAMTDELLLRLVGALGHLPCTWQIIDGGTRARLAALLETAPVSSLIEERTFASGPPADPTMSLSYDKAVQAATADFQDLEVLVRRSTRDRRQWVCTSARSAGHCRIVPIRREPLAVCAAACTGAYQG